jgi:hypothetical protein
MKHLLIGAAVAALAICPLHAQGKGHGGGNGGGHGNAGHGPSMKGPSMKGPSMHGPSMKGPSMKGPSMKGSAMQPAAKGHGNAKAPGRGNGNPHAAQAAGGRNEPAHGNSDVAHAANGADRAHEHGNGNVPGVAAAGKAKAGVRVLQDGRHYYAERGALPAWDFKTARRGPIEGCPPGLARKNNGCQPPGQAKQRTYQPAWWGLGGLASGPYTYDDGYLLRLNGSRVASYVPLLGGALSVGNIWPSSYAPLPVPEYYVDYYDLGPAGGYRYADDVLYRVDPATSAITAIAGLLTGDDIRIGSPMPPGYDVYNVPYPYRSQYPDGPDARYRYSDGYLYQVDPTTQLVTAAIDLLAG